MRLRLAYSHTENRPTASDASKFILDWLSHREHLLIHYLVIWMAWLIVACWMNIGPCYTSVKAVKGSPVTFQTNC